MSDTSSENSLFARIEAVLFTRGDELSFKRLSALTDIEADRIEHLLTAYQARLDADDASGITLLIHNQTVSLVTKPNHASYIKKIAKEELDTPLSPASLETLAIVAYMGPCTRAHIDYIRGVNSGFILRNLSVRGLVERVKDPKGSISPQYRVTPDFLRYIGITKCDTLPAYKAYQEELSRIFEQTNNEEKVEEHKGAQEA
jgi:segregation and condensation protein B